MPPLEGGLPPRSYLEGMDALRFELTRRDRVEDKASFAWLFCKGCWRFGTQRADGWAKNTGNSGFFSTPLLGGWSKSHVHLVRKSSPKGA